MKYPVLSFNAGELSPMTDARSDVDKYRSGCRTMTNMIPRIYGAAERRPGTKYIATCSGVSRLIPFIYSDSISYVIVANNLLFTVYYNGSAVATVVTPYATAHLYELQYAQVNDVMWITHPSYAPRKLSRVSPTSFTLTAITFDDGPFKKRNDLANADGITMTPSVTTGNGTLTASSATFDSTHVGALFSVTQPRVNTNVTGSMTSPTTGVIGSSIVVEGSFTFTTHGVWTGTVVLQRSIDNATWETYRSWSGSADANIQYTGTEDEYPVYYRINVTAMSANTAPGTTTMDSTIEAELTVNSSTQTGWCRVTAYTSALLVSMTVVKAFASTNADVRWAEGCWSPYRGYPTSVTFFENRCVYAGTTHQPQTLWLSAVDDYDFFDETYTNDDDAFSLTLASDKRNAIKWVAALDSLILGTTGGEWRVWSSSYDEPLTPNNFKARMQSTYGSKALQAMAVNDAILFVDRVGRKIREMRFDYGRDKYVAGDLTALAEHITYSGITTMAYQRNPDPILWCTLTDGTVLSMTYEREQDVMAWSTHTSGTADIISIAVIPSTSEDEVWWVAKRTVGGSTVYYLEQMQPRAVVDQHDQWFVDSGVSYDSTATTTVTGGTHLNGETVVVLGDGAVFARNTVASGSITLAESASRVIYGLPYRFTLKPNRFDLAIEGTTKGTLKRIAEVVISFYKSLNVQYGVDTNTLFNIDWRTTEAYGSPPALYTGDKVVAHEGGFDAEDSLVLSGDDPLPCVVRAIIPRIEVTGR